MGKPESSPFSVRVSADRMSATIEVRPDVELGEVSASDILSELEAAKVARDNDVAKRVTEYVELLRSPNGPPEGEYEIAVGRPAVEGEDGEFTWDASLLQQAADWCEDESIDFYRISSIVTVDADALMGRVRRPMQGKDGVDVHVTSLRPESKPQEVILKNGVKLGEDERSVFSTVPGRIHYDHLILSLSEVVEIRGNVDFESGNLDLTTDAMVGGDVLDNFNIKIKKNLTVRGAIEGADVEVVGNVTVRGGIVNHGKGSVVAGGDIVTRFCDSADIKAHGDIRVANEVMSSRVHTEGRLIITGGSIIGGEVFARHGVEVNTLGSEADVITQIVVGLHPDELRKLETNAKANLKRRVTMKKINNAVTPLLADLKRLTSEQREQVTELMNKAGTVATKIAGSEEEMASLLQATGEVEPYVLVTGMIHAGTTITITDRVVTFKEDTKGPIKIGFCKIEDHTVVAATNQVTGSIFELPARETLVSLEPAA